MPVIVIYSLTSELFNRKWIQTVPGKINPDKSLKLIGNYPENGFYQIVGIVEDSALPPSEVGNRVPVMDLPSEYYPRTGEVYCSLFDGVLRLDNEAKAMVSLVETA